MNGSVGDVDKLYQLAVTYRRTVMLLGSSWIVAALSPGRGVIGTMVGVLLFALSVAMAVHGYRLARLLGLVLPPAWGIMLFVPLVNLITLLVLSSKSTAYCRERGVRVGLLGPRLDDIERLGESGLPRAEAR